MIYGLYWVLKQVKSSREERASGQGLSTLATLPLDDTTLQGPPALPVVPTAKPGLGRALRRSLDDLRAKTVIK